MVLVGATCVGKGYEVKLTLKTLKDLVAYRGLRIEVISFGQIIRDKNENDPAFKAEYGNVVGKGGLVDDAKAIELFQEAYDKITAAGDVDLVIVDGFCRSTEQIRWASENNLLSSKDMVFILEAKLKVCLERFTHRKSASDEKREDAEVQTFYRRFHLHSDSVNDLRALLKETSAQIIDIDANSLISETVHPVFMSRLLTAIYDIAVEKATVTQTA